MKKYFEYIGLIKEEPEKVSVPEFKAAKSKEVAQRYLDYLKEINHYQNERRIAIENKNAQLVGQASIVTSIFSLFVPLLIDKFNDFSLWISIPLCLLFLLIMMHYLLTIIHSIRTLEINRFKYPTRSTTSLTKEKRATTEFAFLNEEIADLIYIVNHSTPIDNDKGQNLIFATRSFKIANIGFGVFTFAIIFVSFFFKNETPEMKIKNLDEIHLIIPDTTKNYIINLQKLDTLNVRIDTSKNELNSK